MADASQLEVKTTREGDACVLRPSGDIDLSRSPALRYHLSVVMGTKPSRVIVDLDGVNYMDSSGVATLVEAMQMAKRVGSRFVLCNLQTRVRSIFEIARLDTIFSIAASLDEAYTK